MSNTFQNRSPDQLRASADQDTKITDPGIATSGITDPSSPFPFKSRGYNQPYASRSQPSNPPIQTKVSQYGQTQPIAGGRPQGGGNSRGGGQNGGQAGSGRGSGGNQREGASQRRLA